MLLFWVTKAAEPPGKGSHERRIHPRPVGDLSEGSYKKTAKCVLLPAAHHNIWRSVPHPTLEPTPGRSPPSRQFPRSVPAPRPASPGVATHPRYRVRRSRREGSRSMRRATGQSSYFMPSRLTPNQAVPSRPPAGPGSRPSDGRGRADCYATDRQITVITKRTSPFGLTITRLTISRWCSYVCRKWTRPRRAALPDESRLPTAGPPDETGPAEDDPAGRTG